METKLGSSILFSQDYVYDKESNRTQMVEYKLVDGKLASSTVDYAYDSIGQIPMLTTNTCQPDRTYYILMMLGVIGQVIKQLLASLILIPPILMKLLGFLLTIA